MKVLLDHCVPRPFARRLGSHDAFHTSQLGWGQLSNGKLLRAAEEAHFDVLVTLDRNMQFQQSIAGRQICVVFLHVPRNDVATLSEMALPLERLLSELAPGSLTVLRHPELDRP